MSRQEGSAVDSIASNRSIADSCHCRAKDRQRRVGTYTPCLIIQTIRHPGLSIHCINPHSILSCMESASEGGRSWHDIGTSSFKQYNDLYVVRAFSHNRVT
jgi:hypothetical protein